MHRGRWIPITLMLMAVFFGLLMYKNYWTDGDEGRYAALGRSVSLGRGFALLHHPEKPREFLTPPLYPLLLGAADHALGGSIEAMRWISFLAYLGCAACLIRMIFRLPNFTMEEKIAAAVLACLPVWMLSFAWQIMSEMTYLFFTLLCLSLFHAKHKSAPAWAGLTAGLALLVRPGGLVMIAVAPLVYRGKGRVKRLALFLLCMGAVSMLWLARTQYHTGHWFEHTSHLAAESTTLAGSLWSNLENLTRSFPIYFFRSMPAMLFFSLFDHHHFLETVAGTTVSHWASIAVALVVLGGWASRLRQHPSAYEWYWLFGWLLACIYNQPDYAARGDFFFQPRYIFPLLALSGLYFIAGLSACCRLAGRWLPCCRRPGCKRTVLILPTAYILLTSTAAGMARTAKTFTHWGREGWDPARLADTGFDVDKAFAQYMAAGSWMRDALPVRAVVASRKPEHIWLVSGKKGFRYDADRLEPELGLWDNLLAHRRFGPVYILQDGFPASVDYGKVRISSLNPLLAANRSNLELVYERGDPPTRIWKVIPE